MRDASEINFLALIGAGFEDRGRGPRRFDCWGLVMAVRALGGLHTPDYDASYRDMQGAAACADDEKRRNRFFQVGQPRVYDIVEFKPVEGNLHFGVMIDFHQFLEITNDGAGVRPGHIWTPINRQRISRYWRG